MIMLHWVCAHGADLDLLRKKHLDYCEETTTFPVTESTRNGRTARNPGARLCAAAERTRRIGKRPINNGITRRLTNSPRMGPDASPVECIVFSSMRVTTYRQRRGAKAAAMGLLLLSR